MFKKLSLIGAVSLSLLSQTVTASADEVTIKAVSA